MSSRDRHIDRIAEKICATALKFTYNADSGKYHDAIDKQIVRDCLIEYLNNYLWDLQDKTAIGEISDRAGNLLHKLHGPKMDGPRNETERVLLKIGSICDDVINGEYEYEEVESEG